MAGNDEPEGSAIGKPRMTTREFVSRHSAATFELRFENAKHVIRRAKNQRTMLADGSFEDFQFSITGRRECARPRIERANLSLDQFCRFAPIDLPIIALQLWRAGCGGWILRDA